MRVVWMWASWKVASTTAPMKRLLIRCASAAKILVALGDCAVFGGVPAMRNFCGVEAALKRAYVEAESNEPGSQIPNDPELATMTEARALHDVVPVDYNVPGCPPDADTIFYVLAELAQGRKPELKDELLHWH